MTYWAEDLDETRRGVWAELENATDTDHTLKAVVMALLYIGDCIRYLAYRD